MLTTMSSLSRGSTLFLFIGQRIVGRLYDVTVLGSCNRTGLRKPEISLRSSRGQDLQWQKVTQAWRKGYASLAKVLRKPGERVTQVWERVTQAWRGLQTISY